MTWQGKGLQSTNVTLAYTTLTLEATPLVGGSDDAFKNAGNGISFG